MNEVNLFWIMTSTIQNILIIFRNNNDLWTNSTYLGLLKTSVKFLVVLKMYKVLIPSTLLTYTIIIFIINYLHFFILPFFYR